MLIKPQLNLRSILQVSEDEADGLHHHFPPSVALATLAMVEADKRHISPPAASESNFWNGAPFLKSINHFQISISLHTPKCIILLYYVFALF